MPENPRGNDNEYVELTGSSRRLPESAEQLVDAPAEQEVLVTVVLRRRAELPADAARAGVVSRENFAERHGADPADVDLVRAFAEKYGLRVTEADAATRQVKLTGSVASLQRAFRVRLRSPASSRGALRLREGPIMVPAALADVITGVFGLDNRQQAIPHAQ